MFDEDTRTLFCGDLFTQIGEGLALAHDADLIQPALDPRTCSTQSLDGMNNPHGGGGHIIRRLCVLTGRHAMPSVPTSREDWTIRLAHLRRRVG